MEALAVTTGSAADRLIAWSESDMRPLQEYGPWDALPEAIAAVVAESSAAENERCLDALRAVRSLIPHEEAAALGAIGDAMSRIEAA